MISRKKILHNIYRQTYRNHYSELYVNEEDDDDDEVWYSTDMLYEDHIEEVLRKWDQLDDEIWCKIICMERNRRIAKAYARVPVLTINGTNEGFDGYKIGLNGFENPMRDALTKRVKQHIGKGVRVKIDELGNMIIKRMSNCDVFVRGWDRNENSLSKDILELSGELEFDRSVRLFDMKKFQSNISKELRSSYPDRRKLEAQCICAIGFVKDANDLLDLSSWIMLINIVALDMLKAKLPLSCSKEIIPKFISIFNQSKSSIQDEDPYSMPSLPSSSHRHSQNSQTISKKSKLNQINDKPPELPPRDLNKIKKIKGKNVPKAITYSAKDDNKRPFKSYNDTITSNRLDDYENPYYCGLRAKVTNFNGNRDRKAIAGPTNNGQPSEIMRYQSTNYLNSLLNPTQINYSRASSHISFYNSSGDFDPYAVSSGDAYEIYAPVYTRRYSTQINEEPFQIGRQNYATEWD